jgi:hypothetical protein
VHDPSILVHAIPSEYCHCKVSKIYDFDIGKKKFKGLLEIFFCANAFKVFQQLEYMFQKFSYFFFIGFLGGLPSRVLAGTKKLKTYMKLLQQKYAFKEPQNLVLNS